MEKKRKMFKELKLSEVIGGNLLNVGQGDIMYMYTSSFIMLYLTNSALVSAAFLGTLMLVARIFDAISDILMGAIIEKTNSKWGKARPWLLWSAVPTAIITMMMFWVPSGFSDTGKNIYVTITYFVGVVIMQTMVIMAYHTCMTRMCADSTDRSSFYAITPVVGNIAIIIVVSATPYLLEAFGGSTSQRSWIIVTAIMCVGFLATMIPGFLLVREHPNAETVKQDKGELGKISIIEQIKVAFFNKYFFLLLAMMVLLYTGSGIQGAANIYYCTYVLKSNKAFTLLTMASYAPAIILAPFCVRLFQRYGKIKVSLVGLLLNSAAKFLILLRPYDAVWFLVLILLAAVFEAPAGAAMFSLAGDVSEYGQVRHGIRTDALCTSSFSFASKVGMGLGSAVLGWGLAAGRFDALAASQSEFTLNALIIINIVIPAAMYLITAICFAFWDIDKKIKKEHAKNNV